MLHVLAQHPSVPEYLSEGDREGEGVDPDASVGEHEEAGP